MTRSKEHQPAAVTDGGNLAQAKQAGEIRSRWDWVQPSVWTGRMLTALEVGVKGGKWFSLMDKVTWRGWFEYFKHSLKTTFRPVDSYVRGRLRSILRKRTKRRGRARGSDHQRWPNAFFAERGLFSLVTAHRTACRFPARRDKTTNRRAGCEKIARPVRREGGPKPIGPSYPYQSFHSGVIVSPSVLPSSVSVPVSMSVSWLL